MNRKRVLELIDTIKANLSELETELSVNSIEVENDKDYFHPRYNIKTKKDIHGGKKGLTKVGVFETIISLEAPIKTRDQLNSIFERKLFPVSGGFSTYDYVALASDLKKSSEVIQGKYSKKVFKTKDKQNIRVSNQWAEFENREKKTPGNFPILEAIVQSLGYEIVPVK